jgi:methyl coenzyme M reductase subunit C-like uncharacterized protein (methanogenesis marker protein 7)
MVDTEALKQVEIYEADLEEVLTTLQTAYRWAITWDIFNQYKNLSTTVAPSPLTKQIDRCRVRLQSILDDHYKALENDGVPTE